VTSLIHNLKLKLFFF